MVFAQLLLQFDLADVRAPCATLLHPFSGQRVRIKLLKHEIVYFADPASTTPLRLDFDTFQSNGLTFSTQQPAGSIVSNGQYPFMISNSSGVGLLLNQYNTRQKSSEYGECPIVEGTLLGNALTVYLQLANKAPGDYAVLPADFNTIDNILVYLDITPL
jgi:hypothetical protein